MPIKKQTKKNINKSRGRSSFDYDDANVLSRYLNEISRIKPLTREEEGEIGARIQETNCRESLHELVRRNLKYVVTVANKYKGCGLSLQDLIEEGNIGIIQAAKRFDPNKKVKFITYAVWWIRQAIMHALASQSGTVKLPVKQAGKMYKIERRIKSLSQTLAREPTRAEVANDMGYKEEEIETITRAYRTHLSLDTPLRNNDETHYLDLLESPNYIPYDDQIMRENLKESVDDMLKHLSEREESILRMRFGFHSDPKTLEQIGKEINLSRERVRQIENRAKAKLKKKSEAESLQDNMP